MIPDVTGTVRQPKSVGLIARHNTTGATVLAEYRLLRRSSRRMILLKDDILTPILLPEKETIELEYFENGTLQSSETLAELSENQSVGLKFSRVNHGLNWSISTDGGASWSPPISLQIDISELGFTGEGLSTSETATYSSIAHSGLRTYAYEGYAVYPDHLGTPQQIVSERGNLIWKADYAPFGLATVTTQTIANAVRFAGQYYDQETGLHYNYFRDYDPGTGRYIESDPIGLGGGLNTYGYVLGNPVNFIDPEGLQTLAEVNNQMLQDVYDAGVSTMPTHPKNTYSDRPYLGGTEVCTILYKCPNVSGFHYAHPRGQDNPSSCDPRPIPSGCTCVATAHFHPERPSELSTGVGYDTGWADNHSCPVQMVDADCNVQGYFPVGGNKGHRTPVTPLSSYNVNDAFNGPINYPPGP